MEVCSLAEIINFQEAKEEVILCNFLKCYAGMGVAGDGRCFLGGNKYNKNCKKFVDEKEALEDFKNEMV